VLEEMLPGERAQAHRAFAAALEARLEAGSRAGPESTLVVLAALHWHGAQDDDRALAAAWRAAGAAGTALAYAQRLRMLEQVLELWDRVPEPARPAGLDHVGVLELAADAARWAGEPERGLTLAETAIAKLDAVDDAERMALMLRRRAGLRQELLLPGQLDDLHAALRLVAAGHSNRDIAAELFISPKTASVHVSNILGKLGVSSRGEAAATAYRQHLLDDS
jgi:DNA-binding CsgD family transcriptional regulator